MSNNNSFIVSGPKFEKKIVDETLGKFFTDSLAKRNKNETICIDAVTKKVQTCGMLDNDVIKAVRLFEQLGIQKGDVISLISENVTGYNVPILAAWCIGAVINPLNPEYTIGELRHAFSCSKPKMVLCSSQAIEHVKMLQKEFECLDEIFLFGSNTENGTATTFENVLEHITVDSASFQPEEFSTDAVALILLSSGTTGLPKGVMISHKNTRYIFNVLDDDRYCGMTRGDTLIGVLPFFHIYGFMFYCATILMPIKMIVMSRFKPDLYLSSIQEFKVNKLQIVPPMALFLVQHPLVASYDVSSIEEILYGAASLGTEIQNEAKKRIGNITFRSVYGSTETGGACTFLSNRPDKPNSVGRLLPELQAKVQDLSTGQNLGPMETGELCFKGAGIMLGYIGIPNNNTIIDEDGFYHSGDVGYYDDEDYFYIVDRIKELIKYKGFQVSPTEIEAILLTHHAVKDCGVIGKPDEKAGQVPVAYVVRQTGVGVTEQELVDYVSERISSTKRLYGGVRFLEEIPKNKAGKILRKKLEEMLNET